MHDDVQALAVDSTALCIYRCVVHWLYMMTASEMGKKGIAVVNKNYTTEKRKKAAKKGWKTRRAKTEVKKK